MLAKGPNFLATFPLEALEVDPDGLILYHFSNSCPCSFIHWGSLLKQACCLEMNTASTTRRILIFEMHVREFATQHEVAGELTVFPFPVPKPDLGG